MSGSTEKKQALHRRVLARLGLGTAILVAATRGKPAEAMTPPGTKGSAHYKETDHVKQYYRVNRY